MKKYIIEFKLSRKHTSMVQIDATNKATLMQSITVGKHREYMREMIAKSLSITIRNFRQTDQIG